MSKKNNNIEKIYLLTPMQEGMLFHTLNDESSSAYFTQLFYRTSGQLEVDIFTESLNRLCQRHDILRTAFVYGKTEKPVQVVLKDRKITLTIEDVSSMSAEQYTQYLKQYRTKDIDKGFDLIKDSLIRLTLFKRADNSIDFLWSYHHILLDGWCHTILIEELSEVYNALMNGRTPALPPVISFDRYINWLQEQDITQTKSFWNNYLSDYTNVAEIPHVIPDATTSQDNGKHYLAFNSEVSNELTRIAQNNGVTLNDIFQSVWGLLLARYNNTNDVVYGNVVSGRPMELEGVERCLGLFINTIPIRVQFKETDTFLNLIKSIHQDAIEALPHHYSSLANIQSGSALKGDLIKHVLAFENYPLDQINEEGEAATFSQVSDIDVFDQTNYDFDLDIELGATINVSFFFNTKKYNSAYIKNIAASFEHLVHQFIGNPSIELGNTNLVTDEAKNKLLFEFNSEAVDLGNDLPINVRFEDQVILSEADTAIIHNNEKWTYEQLNKMANQVAHSLLKQGIKAGDFVGIHMKRCPELVAALLGILKAGAAYVPLDRQNPKPRTIQLIKDSSIKFLISSSSLLEELTTNEVVSDNLLGILCMDLAAKPVQDFFTEQALPLLDSTSLEKTASSNPSNQNQMDSWAYMLYTSGSTGKPKGAITRHNGALNHILAEFEALQLANDFRFLQSASIASDISVWQILAPILKGGSIVILDKDNILEFDRVVETMQNQKVTIAEFVPSYLTYLVAYLQTLDNTDDLLPNLRWMMIVGEEVPVKLVNDWLALFPNCKVLNGYGPCEASDDITQFVITTPLDESTTKVPIGTPISNMNIFVLDKNEKLLPVGVPGEICVSGVGVGVGYCGEPEKTALHFKPNPFKGTLGETMYKTGDLARWLPDGNLEFLGRIDRQVKIRGNRVELGEIEAFLQQDSLVKDAHVMFHSQPNEEVQLLAFLVLDETHPDMVTKKILKDQETHILKQINNNPELKKSILQLENGLKFFQLNPSETNFVYNEIFKDQTYLKHGIHLEEGAVVFDIGANVGMFSVFVSTHFPGSEIFAFEPLPPTYQMLEANSQLYSSTATIHAYKAGISDKKQKATFTHYPENTMLSGRYGDLEADKEYVSNVLKQRIKNKKDINLEDVTMLVDQSMEQESFECDLLPISEVIRNHNIEKIDLLKIDVERSEIDVLMGIEAQDWPKIQQIVIEVHEEDNRLSFVTELLEEKGFSFHIEQEELLQDTDLYNIYAVRPENVNIKEKQNKIRKSKEQFQLNVQSSLPDYMQPSAYCVIDSIPLNLSDKVDEKALISLYKEQQVDNKQSEEQGMTDNCTATEAVIKSIWEHILNQTNIGIDKDFFRLGGHSLLAMRVKVAIHKKLDANLEIRDLFTYTTIKSLAAFIDNKDKQESGNLITARNRPAKIPLSFAQERLWFIDQLQGSVEYHIPAILQFSGEVNQVILEKCLKDIINRHEVLKTVVSTSEGIPHQQIITDKQWNLNLYTPETKLTKVELDEKIAAIIAEPFDLTKDYKVRVTLIKQSETEYLLVLVMHHIASDGWSESIFVEELMELYAARINNRQAQLPTLDIQYMDYAIWQHENKERLTTQIEFWKNKLADVSMLELPTDFNRPKIHQIQGASVGHKINEALISKLKQISTENGVTLFMTLLAAFKVLLYRYTGQNDICIGTPIAGRTQEELERLIGYFVNTLPLRSDLSGNPKFSNYLALIKQTLLDAYANQEVPFEKIVEVTALERDLSRNPIFQVMFTLQNTPTVKDLELGELSVTPLDPSDITTAFDLHFNIEETAKNGVVLEIEYSTSLFKQATIERMFNHYLVLLDAITKNIETNIDDLEYITQAEKTEILNTFAGTVQKVPTHKTIPSLFEEVVLQYGNQVAIVGNNSKLTYSMLNVKANQLAHLLKSNYTIQPEERIGIIMSRSTDFVIAMLAILKCGGAYLPIDIDKIPKERIAYQLDKANVNIIITNETVYFDDFSDGYQAVLLEDELLDKQPKNNLPLHKTNSNSLAYIMFTSGSTGNPKGVMIEHRGVVRLVKDINYTSCTNKDKILQTGSLSFDAATFEIWGPLLNGGQVHLLPLFDLLDIQKIAHEIKHRDITKIFITTQWFNKLVDVNPLVFESVEHVLVGGEALSAEHVKKAKLFCKNTIFSNIYGPTENTTFSTSGVISDNFNQNISIGIPISNSTAYIVDNNLRIVPKGIPGELLLGGEGISRGYINDDEKTKKQFIAHPFLKNERLYRSGDMVRWKEDGRIEFIGRLDNQVKINGFRLEPNEIVNTLNLFPTIKESVVIVAKKDNGEKMLVGYFVTKKPILESEVKHYLEKQLPSYMIPSFLIMVDSIPLNANGKVDKKKLPKPVFKATEYIAPKNLIEQKICKIWGELLGIDHEKISTNANFFTLSGHSLLAMRVVARIQLETGLELSIATLFEKPTVSQLAEVLVKENRKATITIPTIPSSDYYEASHIQKGMWLEDQMKQDKTVNNMVFGYEINEKLDIEVLEEAICRLIERHEILRTNFVEIDGKLRQKIHDFETYQADFKSKSSSSLAADTEQLLKTEQSHSFYLNKGSLIRFRFLTNETKQVFVINLHHIIGDGWSMDVLRKEIFLFYYQIKNGAVSNIAPLTIQNKDYATWHNTLIHDNSISEKYWCNLLKDISNRPELPFDKQRPQVRQTAAKHLQFELNQVLSKKLRDYATTHHVSMFVVFQTLLKSYLCKYLNASEIVVGTPVACRNHPALKDQIGCYVNMLALRTFVEPEASFINLLNTIASETKTALQHQSYPHDLLVKKLNIARDVSRNPLYDIAISCNDFEDQQEAKNLEFTEINSETTQNSSKYDLFFQFETLLEGNISIDLMYNTSIYFDSSIQTMKEEFLVFANEILLAPTKPLIDIIKTEAQVYELVDDFM